MSRAFSFSLSSVTIFMMVLALAGCQTVPASSGQPVPLSPVEKQDLSAPVPSPSSSLEKRVEALEGQMKAAQPTLKKVDAMETHFKALSLELGQIGAAHNIDAESVVKDPLGHKESEHGAVKPAELAKAAEKEPSGKKIRTEKTEKASKDIAKESSSPKALSRTAHAAGAGLAVTSVRIGEKAKNVTRIVLDTTKAAEIHYDVDNEEKVLVVDIPKAEWKTTDSFPALTSAVVKSFRSHSDESGAHLVVDLKQAAKVIATARLTPNGSSGHRVYIDIAPVK